MAPLCARLMARSSSLLAICTLSLGAMDDCATEECGTVGTDSAVLLQFRVEKENHSSARIHEAELKLPRVQQEASFNKMNSERMPREADTDQQALQTSATWFAAEPPTTYSEAHLLQSKVQSLESGMNSTKDEAGRLSLEVPAQLRAKGLGKRFPGHERSSSLITLEKTVPKRDKSCSSSSDCGWHARCDMDIGECASLKFGEDLRADVIMGSLSFLIAGISLACGVGGGGLNVPLLMVVLSFDAHVATAVSQAMLTGGALAAFFINCNDSHPTCPHRPMINYELASLIGASVVAGAQVGSVIHATAPPALILALLCILLIDAARKGVRNALKEQKKEDEEKAAAQESDKTKVQAPPEGDDSNQPGATDKDEKVIERAALAKRQLLVFWFLCVVLVVSKNLAFRICTLPWWLMTLAAVLILGAFAYKLARDLAADSPVDENDLDFTELAMPLLRLCIVAGILAALCGIGGGMVIGPILVENKVPPQISAATTATTLVVLASSTCLVYACRGTAPWRYALMLSACTFMGAGVGKVVIGRWIRKTGKQSVLVWILAGITILSTVLMASQGLKTVMHDGYKAFYFRNFCHGVRSDVSEQQEINAPAIPHEHLHVLLLMVKNTIGGVAC